jgi:hypothetical protein
MMDRTKPIFDLSLLDELLKQEELSASFGSSVDADGNYTSVSSSHADETTLFCEESSFSEFSDDEENEEEGMIDQDESCAIANGRVHFALSRNQIYPHIHRACLTKNERLNTWYSDDEYLSFSNEIIALSIKVSTGTLISETDQQTVRGLEAKMDVESYIRYRRRREILQSVLGEYQRQCWEGTFDQSKLCEESKRHSLESAKEAAQRGHEDEVIVRLQWNHQELDGDKWGSCRQESHDSAPTISRRRSSLDSTSVSTKDREMIHDDGVGENRSTFSPTTTILSSFASD